MTYLHFRLKPTSEIEDIRLFWKLYRLELISKAQFWEEVDEVWTDYWCSTEFSTVTHYQPVFLNHNILWSQS